MPETRQRPGDTSDNPIPLYTRERALPCQAVPVPQSPRPLKFASDGDLGTDPQNGVNMSILACPFDLGNPAQKQALIPHTCTPPTGAVSY